MSHIVSLHFDNPFEEGSIENKLDAVDGIPVAAGDHVEVVGIWQNEDGSIGIHVEVIEKPIPVNSTEAPKQQINDKAQEPATQNEAENSNENLESLNEVDPSQDTIERAPHDHITKADMAHGSGDEALELTPDMQKADDEFEEDFDLAAEGQISELEAKQKLKKEIEASYDKQKEIMPEISNAPDADS